MNDIETTCGFFSKILAVIFKPFTLSGRDGRVAFALWKILGNLLGYVLAIELVFLLPETSLVVFGFLLLVWFNICTDVRRFHDSGRSGWWVFGMVVPLFNIYLLGLLFFARGEEEPNQYDENEEELAFGGTL